MLLALVGYATFFQVHNNGVDNVIIDVMLIWLIIFIIIILMLTYL